MTIDTSTAAVEWEGHPDCGIECWFAPTLRALLVERDAAVAVSQAETAAVIERAECVVLDWQKLLLKGETIEWHVRRVTAAIRALKTPDQTAALDAVKAEAKADGMRKAVGIVDATYAARQRDGLPAGFNMMMAAKEAILAAIPKGGA